MDRQLVVQALYEFVENLDDRLSSLREESERLFAECELARDRKLPCADPRKLEQTYWQLQEGIRNLEAREGRVLSAIEKAESGEDIDVLSVAPELEPLFKESSRKRKNVPPREEEPMMWYDLYPIDPWASQHIQHQDGRFLRTGRRQTHVTGRFTPEEAELAFACATHDTHGGKVRRGSKAGKGTYVTKSGKVVRKF